MSSYMTSCLYFLLKARVICVDLHSLWDGLLIAKALRNIPFTSNYSYPLPIAGIESNLRGAIYDSYIRKIMWEGIGVGAYSEVPGRWEDEVDAWLECPASESTLASTFMHPFAETIEASATGMAWMQMVMGYLWPTWFAGRKERKAVELDWDDQKLCPYAWAKPIHELNCDLVWPPEIDEPPYSHSTNSRFGRASSSLGGHGHAHGCGHGAASVGEEIQQLHAFMDGTTEDSHMKEGDWLGLTTPRNTYLELDTPKYAGMIEKGWVLEKLLAMAGIRLAGHLNDVFAPLVEEFSLKVD